MTIPSINQMPCSLAKAIMTFHTCEFLFIISVSVTRPTSTPSTHLNSSSLLVYLSLVLPLATLFVHPTSFLAFFLRSFHMLQDVPISLLKKVAWHLHILFMSDLVVSAFHNTVSFDFFVVHEICIILIGTSFLLPLVSLAALLKSSRLRIHSFIRMGSI